MPLLKLLFLQMAVILATVRLTAVAFRVAGKSKSGVFVGGRADRRRFSAGAQDLRFKALRTVRFLRPPVKTRAFGMTPCRSARG